MNDTNERQATNACTHTDDGSVCAKCLGVDVADKTIATLAAERDAAVYRQALIEAQESLDTEGVRSESIDTLLTNTTAGADLLAELTRLRKLEAWADGFIERVQEKSPELYLYRGWVDFEHDSVIYKIAQELRALLKSEAK